MLRSKSKESRVEVAVSAGLELERTAGGGGGGCLSGFAVALPLAPVFALVLAPLLALLLAPAEEGIKSTRILSNSLSVSSMYSSISGEESLSKDD